MMIKKVILLFPMMFFCKFASASYKVEFLNSTGRTVNYLVEVGNVITSNLFSDLTLRSGKVLNLYTNEQIIIDSSFKVEFIDTHISCSWISILGKSFSHGWGISLLVNKVNVGTICANKKSVIDFYAHAKLQYYNDESGGEFLNFDSSGWWMNSNIYPTSIKYKL